MFVASSRNRQMDQQQRSKLMKAIQGRDTKDTKDAKNAKNAKDAKSAKDAKDAKDAKPDVRESSRNGRSGSTRCRSQGLGDLGNVNTEDVDPLVRGSTSTDHRISTGKSSRTSLAGSGMSRLNSNAERAFQVTVLKP